MKVLFIYLLYLFATPAEGDFTTKPLYPMQGGWLTINREWLGSYWRHFVGDNSHNEDSVLIYEIHYLNELKEPLFYVDHCLAHELTRIPTQKELNSFNLLSKDRQEIFFSLSMESRGELNEKQKIFNAKFNMNACRISGLVKYIPKNKKNIIHIHIEYYDGTKFLMPDIDLIIKDGSRLKTFLILIPKNVILDEKKKNDSILVNGFLNK